MREEVENGRIKKHKNSLTQVRIGEHGNPKLTNLFRFNMHRVKWL
jgi:hypothetical protein